MVRLFLLCGGCYCVLWGSGGLFVFFVARMIFLIFRKSFMSCKKTNLGLSQYHESLNNEAKNSCAFSAVTYMILTFLRTSVNVLRDVVPFARASYQEHCQKQKLDRFVSQFTASDVAKYFGLSENSDFREMGGQIFYDQIVGGFSYPSLRSALIRLSKRQRFFAVLTLGASSRAIEKDDNVFRLYDSHGSIGNTFVPLSEQSQDFAARLEFRRLHDLLNCLLGFRPHADDEYYSLLYLRKKPQKSLQYFVTKVQETVNPTPASARASNVPTSSSSSTQTPAPTTSYAAAAAKQFRGSVAVPRVPVLPRYLFLFCFAS